MNKPFNYRLDEPSDKIVPRFYVNPERLREVLLLPEGTMISGCTYDYHYNRFVFFVSGNGVPNEKVVIPWYRQEDGVTKFDGWKGGNAAIKCIGGGWPANPWPNATAQDDMGFDARLES